MRIAAAGRTGVVALAALLTSGCAGARSMAGAGTDAAILGTHARADVITAEELASVDGPGTVDAVRRLRPAFLRGSVRTTRGVPEIAVYVDDRYDGDLTSLATIPMRVIRRIVFLEPVEARVRFGPRCPCASGALLVTTRALDGTA